MLTYTWKMLRTCDGIILWQEQENQIELEGVAVSVAQMRV